MQKELNIKRTRALILAVLLLLEFFLAFCSMTSYAVEVSVQSYDDTDISDDLANIDLTPYIKNPSGNAEVISVVEYCYSEDILKSQYYGIYVYIYNPTQKRISTSSDLNTLNSCVSFQGDSVKDYDKIGLIFLDKTNDNLFYKFKLEDSGTFLDMAKEYADEHDGVRRYEFIDLELKFPNEDIVKIDLDCSYEFKGYAAYCAPDNSSECTLESTSFGVRSIHLNLTQTNYRFAKKEDGKTQDELNSVFFTIPEEYFDDFGNLNSIYAQWYEYKTAPMFVTSNADAYIEFWEYRNKAPDRCNYYVVSKSHEVYNGAYGLWHYFYYTYNTSSISEKEKMELDDISCYILYDNRMYGKGGYYLTYDDLNYGAINWLFYTDKITGEDAYCISKEEVVEYARKYTNLFNDPIKVRDKYAYTLFSKAVYGPNPITGDSKLYYDGYYSIDSDRLGFLESNRLKDANGKYIYENGQVKWEENATTGLVKMKFTAGEDFDINTGNQFIDSNKNQSWWNKFWFGTDYETINYSPIVTISEADLILDDSAFCEKYYVNKNDVKNIKDEVKKAYANNERPVLLRFAVTDYVASEAVFENIETERYTDANGYVAQETVFLDFDVISMGFKSEDGYTETVIGVAATPIDIINGLTPPDSLVENEEWWQKIMLVLAVIVLLLLFSVLSGPISFVLRIFYDAIKFVVSFVIKIVIFPFKMIALIFKR